MRALLVNPLGEGIPFEATELIRGIGWDITPAASYADAIQAASETAFDAVIVSEPRQGESAATDQETDFDSLIVLIEQRRIAAVVMADHSVETNAHDLSLIDTVDRTISAAELKGRLQLIEKYHPLVSRMERELSHVQRLVRRLGRHFQEVDQEMRLAGRLQRDFLPNLEKPIGNAQFAAIYRPALWVSGDMFDVFRVTEEITGFYVADAVGHGMAASLLTMFIKRAIVSKRIEHDSYTILTPSETLAALNDALTDQSLPQSQFVTACYGLFNHRTLKLQIARGGHPYPIVISTDGELRELKSVGSLLGIFKGVEFPTYETLLQPGDKLLMYTDGMELIPSDSADSAEIVDQGNHIHEMFKPYAEMPIREMMPRIEAQLDRRAGSLDPYDDVTVVGFEVLDG